MLCLSLSAAFCYAHGVARQENEKGKDIPIVVISRVNHGSSDKGNAIVPTLSEHVLTVVFTENLGQVAVEITTATGTTVDCVSVHTPNGLQIYIPNTGDYIITFTLPNGDEYYGEFTVTD